MFAAEPTLDHSMSERDEWNRKIIDEFRSNAGVVGGPFEGVPILLLHHRGAKTGTERVNPLAYRRDGDNYVVFASKAGAPTNPDWFHNLRAHPAVEIEVGTETVPVTATVAGPDERERLWELQKRDSSAFADYEQKTTRQIPVVVLERAKTDGRS
jgi:deazaflavin-dependent oxidoreductase (nitroreductase family)